MHLSPYITIDLDGIDHFSIRARYEKCKKCNKKKRKASIQNKFDWAGNFSPLSCAGAPSGIWGRYGSWLWVVASGGSKNTAWVAFDMEHWRSISEDLFTVPLHGVGQARKRMVSLIANESILTFAAIADATLWFSAGDMDRGK